MISKRSPLVLVILIACGGPNTPNEVTSSVSIRTDTSGGVQYTTVNRRFHMTADWYTPILLEETVETHCCLGGERNRWGTISLKGWLNPTSTLGDADWSITITADSGEIWRDFYRARLVGCCDMDDHVEYVHLRTGVATFSVSHYWLSENPQLFSIDVPNSRLKRFIGFHGRADGVDPPEVQSDSSIIGVLQYGPAEGPVARLVIANTSGRSGPYRFTDLIVTGDGRAVGERHFDLWGADKATDPEAIGGFTVEIVFERLDADAPRSVFVPFERDAWAVNSITLPDGWIVK